MHRVILDTLMGRESAVDQRGTHAGNLVRGNRGLGTTATESDAAHNIAGRDSPRHWYDEVGVVVVRVQSVRTEIDDLVAGRKQRLRNFMLQAKPAVIGGNPHLHDRFLHV
jgi:hypothetical protein